jgi:hypothetical protein
MVLGLPPPQEAQQGIPTCGVVEYHRLLMQAVFPREHIQLLSPMPIHVLQHPHLLLSVNQRPHCPPVIPMKWMLLVLVAPPVQLLSPQLEEQAVIPIRGMILLRKQPKQLRTCLQGHIASQLLMPIHALRHL